MKRYLYLIVLLLIACCVVGLTACSEEEKNTVEITTSKSGTIDVEVFSAEQAAKDGKIALTPLVGVTDKSITDDGQGLFTIRITESGDGTTAISKEKAQAGETVTVTATPAENWRLDGLAINGESLPDGVFTFTMPERNVEVIASYVCLAHRVDGNEHISFDNDSHDIVEGRRKYFTVEYHEENRYYDDSDVKCLCNGESVEVRFEEIVDRDWYTARRYSFIAPGEDCYIELTAHPWRSITKVEFFKSDWEKIQAEQYSVEIYCGDALYDMGSKVKDGSTFHVKLSFDGFPYKISDLYSWTSSHLFDFTADETEPGEITFKLDHDHQGGIPDDVELGVRIEEDTTQYTVTLEHEGSGTVTSDVKYAKGGKTVTVDAVPEDGYALVSIYITTDGENYTKIDKKNEKYSFVMPENDVTVKARFLTESNKHQVIIQVGYYEHDYYYDNGNILLTYGGESNERALWGEEYEGETVFFHVDTDEGYLIKANDPNGDTTITSLGNGNYSFVMPETTILIVVNSRREFEWSIKSRKAEFGDYLETWTITGSISGEHKDEETFKVAEGESLTISVKAKSGEGLYSLSIENEYGIDDRYEYYSLGGVTSYSTQIGEVLADSYDNYIVVEIY